MKIFDFFSFRPGSRVLIEASAGTGKTYTIAGLFARFIAEGRCKADQILVVTFTKAATRELKARIYERLSECYRMLNAPDNTTADDFGRQFLKIFKNDPEALKRIREAITNFDDVTISTIHGFCQSALGEQVLAAGVPAEWEIAESNRLLEEVCQDYWRNFISETVKTGAGQLMYEIFKSIAKDPEELANLTGNVISRPYALLEPSPDDLTDPVSWTKDVVQLKQELKDIWQKEQDEICGELASSNLSGFTVRSLSKWRIEIDNLLFTNDLKTLRSKNLVKFTSSYHQNPGNYTRNGRESEFSRRFYLLCDRLQTLLESLDEAKTALQLQMVNSVAGIYENKRRSSSTFTYDDLLISMAKSLQGRSGSYFSNRLRTKYPIALVDEFQDTDPVQYEIFSSIYPKKETGCSLVMIGDPKQAIYEFRGADVYAYLQARNDSDPASRYTLNKNYRSNPGVISSVNALFTNEEDIFLLDDFSFQPAGHGIINEQLLKNGIPIKPMQVIINRNEAGEYQNKEDLKRSIYSDVAQRIASLMPGNENVNYTIGDKPLQAGDIAVLVNSHREGDSIREELKRLNIRSVKISRQNVFNSIEAYRIQLLLESVSEPGRRESVKKYLLSGFKGLDLSEFPREDEEEKLNQYREELEICRQKVESNGFYAAFRWLLFEKNGLVRISGLQDTDRVISNLYQISELCSRAETDHSLQTDGLLKWLLEKRREKKTKSEDDQLRIENDSGLVKITTIHSSKGLSYPVVFAPFLWNTTRLNTNPPISWHRKENGKFRHVMNFSFGDTPLKELAESESLIEKTAEEVRKAYVTLTRARYANFLYWGTAQDSCFSGLGALLSGSKKLTPYFSGVRNMKQGSGELQPGYFTTKFEEIANENPKVFEISALNDLKRGTIDRKSDVNGRIMTMPFTASDQLVPGKKLFSFSSVATHGETPALEPGYDETLQTVLIEEPITMNQEPNLFNFPKGANAGTIIHQVFESQVFGRNNSVQLHEKIKKLLEKNRYETKWTNCLIKMVDDLNQAPLWIPGGKPLRLNLLGEKDQLSEMEFQLRSREPRFNEVLSLIRNGRPMELEKQSLIKSFMKGFIDLVVMQNDMFYIIDYKSNYLGDQYNDYNLEFLKEEIREKSYDIQYHFYTLALSKYLESRIPDYDYPVHFGGVFYLFVRGIRPGDKTGIFYHKPEEKIMSMLDRWLCTVTEV